MNPEPSGTLSIYFCGTEPCAPGHAFGPAVRPHYLIHVVLDGKGIYKRNGETYHLKAGDAFLISPMESTYYQADEKEPWRYAWVGFDGMSAKDLLERTCFRNSCVYFCPHDEKKREAVIAHVLELLDSFLARGQNSLTLLGHFFQLLGTMQSPEPAGREEYPRQYLAKAMEYMNNNYSYNIRISDIASYIGVDRSYLYRIFMEEEHISPKQYLMRLRHRCQYAALTPVYHHGDCLLLRVSGCGCLLQPVPQGHGIYAQPVSGIPKRGDKIYPVAEV